MTTTPKRNEASLAAFLAGKAEIDALLVRVSAASGDHFDTKRGGHGPGGKYSQ